VSAPLEFEKYEGLGNDFIVVAAAEPLPKDAVIRLCDRHFGIGADGVLVVSKPTRAGSRATMTVQNADGSRPEMCGNGLRCVALRLAAEDGREQTEYLIDTDAGARRCEVSRHGGTASVLIEMGRAEDRGQQGAQLGDRYQTFELVSVGNPHAVALDFFPNVDSVDRFAPAVSGAIPGGANVEFVQATPNGAFRVVVWERGVGRTLACGTGAAAVASVLARTGRIPFEEPARVALPGGELELVVAKSFDVRLRGPAQLVFRGKVDLGL